MSAIVDIMQALNTLELRKSFLTSGFIHPYDSYGT